ncbi:MAG: class I SAM-dependent methyltransferase [Spirochaetes bacterium]|jgi:SAM-dependent methyltransferase|nr:class I SAM-dependent methyltransferase [Spirochaetota bacterium]
MKLYHELAEYYYSLEEQHRNIDDDISLIKSLVAYKKNPSLLDLGCGTGEHLSRLSRIGIKCTGIDTSASMLRIAKLRFPDSIEFQNQDMRFISYNKKFDIIICLFGSFNYITEDSDINNVFKNTWNALKPDGIGLFEIWNSIPILKIKEKPVSRVSRIDYGGKEIERERGFKLLNNLNKTLVEVNYNYIISKKETIKDRHIMRAYKKDEIADFIINNDFRICNFYANTLGEPYSPTSNAIVIRFQKV